MIAKVPLTPTASFPENAHRYQFAQSTILSANCAVEPVAKRRRRTARISLYGDWRWYLPSAKELERSLGLHVVARENDGVVYQARRDDRTKK
jgi:hypothetical protein